MSSRVFFHHRASPIGPLLLLSDGASLVGLYTPGSTPRGTASDAVEDPAPLREVSAQLDRYFAGELTRFDVPMQLSGTPFQRAVWSELCAIPYGVTVSYRELAVRVGNPRAMRAVGAANGRNPVSIIVPCHRVIGADGTLVGYGGGIACKRWLLSHERALVARPRANGYGSSAALATAIAK